MRKILNKQIFIFKLAYKNLIYHPLRSLLLGLGFLGVSVIIFLALSMKPMMYNYYYGMVEEQYDNIDMILDVSQTGSTRFFSIGFLNNESVKEVTDDFYPFFEFDILANADNEQAYVHMFASSIENLKVISNVDEINISNLKNDEVIITASYAKSYDIELGDQIIINASNTSKAFKVVNIIEDRGLFVGSSIFIDKDTSIAFFLESLSPTLSNFPPALLVNLYNRVYVDIDDDATYDQVQTLLTELNSYQLRYTQTYNMTAINNDVSRMTALFNSVMMFVFAAVLLVLETTLSVYFYDKKKTNGIINILGGRTSFSLEVICVELFMLSVVTFGLGLWITNRVIALGYTYLNSSALYEISGKFIVFSMMIYIALFLLVLMIYTRNYSKNQDIRELNVEGEEKAISIIPYIFASLICVLIYLLMFIDGINQWINPYQVIVQLITVGLFIFLTISLTVQIFKLIRGKTKKSRLRFLLFKKILNKRQFYQYMSILTIVFIVCFSLVLNINHLNKRINRLEEEYQFDLLVTRIVDNQDEIYDDIKNMDLVDDAIRVGYYENVVSKVNDQSITQVLSIEGSKIDQYFNLNISQKTIDNFESMDQLEIILPYKYQKVYGYKPGDTFALSFDGTANDIAFKIAGFFQKESIELAFVNLYISPVYSQMSSQTIMIQSSDKSQLEEELIEVYGQRMIIVIDYEKAFVEPMVDQMRKVINYVSAIMGVMMFSFMISLVNHSTLLQTNLATDDAKILTLGLTKRKIIMNYWKNQGFVLIATIIISSIGFIMIYQLLENVLIMFNVYEQISLTPQTYLVGLMINTTLWIIIMIYQSYLIGKIEEIDYIRTF